MKILLLGDSHGDLRHIRFAIEKAQEFECSTIFSLGDTGMWVHCSDGMAYLNAVNRICGEEGIEFYWLDGNHDPLIHVLDMFDEYDDNGFLVMREHVRYAPRGLHWKWSNVRFCSLGGAYSIDQRYRESRYREIRDVLANANRPIAKDELDQMCKPYELWWHGEMIEPEDVQRAIAGGEIDVLLSHDTGTDVDVALEFAKRGAQFFKNERMTEMNRENVQRVIDACRPSRCFNGHYHLQWRQRVHAVDYCALDCNLSKEKSWWVIEV